MQALETGEEAATDEEDIPNHHPFVPLNNPSPFDATSAEMLTPIRSIKEKADVWLPMNTVNGSTKLLEIESFASPSIYMQVDVVAEPLAHILTHAHSVETSTTDLRNALPENIYPIITKLDANAWEKALTDASICEKYTDILTGLREGFPCIGGDDV